MTAGDHPDAVALRTAGSHPDREYDYRRLRDDAAKTGNLLAALGVRDGRTLGVAADPPAPEAVLALLGAATTGAVVRFAPSEDRDTGSEAALRGILAPSDRVGEYDLPPGGQRVGYGDPPGDPRVTGFEEEMWSENPTVPPPTVGPGDPLLSTPDGSIAHGTVLAAARRVRKEEEIDPGDSVVVRASLGDPRVVVAGVVAPLLAGATVVLLPDGAGSPLEARGSVAIATDEAPEGRWIDPASVSLE
ncbi:hypothetical protein BRD00_14835 [Halobacteriales archaeon QS_8_69_26]|nr:MAG: hypothetical protein BRD00_14835 [Halobacteriales archaeon QS_8_69_26]